MGRTSCSCARSAQPDHNLFPSKSFPAPPPANGPRRSRAVARGDVLRDAGVALAHPGGGSGDDDDSSISRLKLDTPRLTARAVETAIERADRTESRHDRAERDADKEREIQHAPTVVSSCLRSHDLSVMRAGPVGPHSGRGALHVARWLGDRTERRGSRGAGPPVCGDPA